MDTITDVHECIQGPVCEAPTYDMGLNGAGQQVIITVTCRHWTCQAITDSAAYCCACMAEAIKEDQELDEIEQMLDDAERDEGSGS